MAIEAVVIEGAKEFATTALSKLFGIAPRGEFRKFQRTLYPVMASKATLTGFDVVALWFGDAVRVQPGGDWGIDRQVGNVEGMLAYERELVQSGISFWAMRCSAGVDFNDPNDVRDLCSFVGMGQAINQPRPGGSPPVVGDGQSPPPQQAGLSPLLLAAAAVGGLLFFFS